MAAGKGAHYINRQNPLGVGGLFYLHPWKRSPGRPSRVFFVDQICGFGFGLIWDERGSLKRFLALSHPKPTINARGHSAEAVYMANLLAQNIDRLSAADCQMVTDVIATCLHQGDDEDAQHL
ncbi:MAG: hypothetical protein CM15mP46_0230 [Alphaproteobacteria bacterium]|nr:MAG: hypothetical protein CM15mP46_0230 [Alphaproteobacteria bacterium]